jgi:hypothetical protein
MKVPLTAGAVFAFVTGAALVGMVLGGTFGIVASRLTPDFFSHFVSWAVFADPEGVAIMLGSFGGVLCGGLLGGFAIAAQLLGMWLSRRQDQAGK